MRSMKLLLPLVASAAVAVAAPAPLLSELLTPTATTQAPITDASQMVSAIDGFEDDGKDLEQFGEELLGVLNAIVPLAKPTSIPDALARAAKIYSQHYADLFKNGGAILLEGLTPGDAKTISDGETLYSSPNNTGNPAVSGIYPAKSSADAPYSLPEDEYRRAIFFPPGFTHGRVRPLIFVPGTGGYAGQHFAANAGKLYAGSAFADPVYLNIPNALLDDVQLNAEYVAYAINYVAALTGTRPSLYSWSAGGLAVRWAGKYWPSSRASVTNHVAISADYHGTTVAYSSDPQYPRTGRVPPAVVQQEYNSTFIATMRNNGGDSPYFPTTSVFSGFDQVVEPQGTTGVTNASAYAFDVNRQGVTNIYLQDHCPSATPGGSPYNSHEGVLYNALALTAATQALKSGKNADLGTIDVGAECAKFAADGLSLPDILATEATIPLALIEIIAYPKKVGPEPTIRPYAKKDIPAGYCDGC